MPNRKKVPKKAKKELKGVKKTKRGNQTSLEKVKQDAHEAMFDLDNQVEKHERFVARAWFIFTGLHEEDYPEDPEKDSEKDSDSKEDGGSVKRKYYRDQIPQRVRNLFPEPCHENSDSDKEGKDYPEDPEDPEDPKDPDDSDDDFW